MSMYWTIIIMSRFLLSFNSKVNVFVDVSPQVNVFGFGADSRGNWHHYWEQNRYSGEFRKTGVHDADYEAQIIDKLAKAGKISVFPGKWIWAPGA